MGISSFSLFESARKGLAANQLALSVVSQNVSNASTEGYTRQEVLLTNTASLGSSSIGTGVEVAEVRQIRDTYIESQLRLQNQVSSYWSTEQNYLERIQTFLNETSGAGISDLMSKFWKAAEDVSNAPQSQTTRLAMIQAGESLTQGIQYAAKQITEVSSSINSAIPEKVDQLNSISKRIAEINTQIIKFENAGLKMNDLRDERTRLINELSGLASIQVTKNNNLDDSLITINGHELVNCASYKQLETTILSDGSYGIKWKGEENLASSNSSIASAKVLSDAASGIYNLNISSLAESFSVSSKSYALNGASMLSGLGVKNGTVSINGKDVTIDAQKLNIDGLIKLINNSSCGATASLDSGGKLVLKSSSTGADSKITLEDKNSNLFEKLGLTASITSSPNPAIKNADESLNISGSFTINGIRISTVQGQTDSLNRIASEINGAVGSVTASVITGSDGNNSLRIAAKDGYSKIELSDSNDNLLYRLGLLKAPQTKQTVDAVNISGGKDAKFTVNNTDYSSATNNVKNVISGVELSLNAKGNVQINSKPTISGGEIGALLSVRDKSVPDYISKIANFAKTLTSEFNSIHRSGFDLNGESGVNFFDAINVSSDASAQKIIDSIKMNAELKDDPSKFAAAGIDSDYFSQSGIIRSKGTGDNTAALKYTKLKTAAVFSDGSTLTDKFSEIISKIGSEVNTAQKTSTSQKAILTNLKLKKESVSGVSMDEEISNMMKYQHAYSASAKMINVIDGMLDTIINGLLK